MLNNLMEILELSASKFRGRRRGHVPSSVPRIYVGLKIEFMLHGGKEAEARGQKELTLRFSVRQAKHICHSKFSSERYTKNTISGMAKSVDVRGAAPTRTQEA